MYLDCEDRKEADELQREQIGELPWSEQLAVEADLRRLRAKGYYEDELMWSYERLLAQRGQAFPGEPA